VKKPKGVMVESKAPTRKALLMRIVDEEGDREWTREHKTAARKLVRSKPVRDILLPHGNPELRLFVIYLYSHGVGPLNIREHEAKWVAFARSTAGANRQAARAVKNTSGMDRELRLQASSKRGGIRAEPLEKMADTPRPTPNPPAPAPAEPKLPPKRETKAAREKRLMIYAEWCGWCKRNTDGRGFYMPCSRCQTKDYEDAQLRRKLHGK